MESPENSLNQPLWERQPGEPTVWYRRFCRYRNQIGVRSLLGAVRSEYQESGKKQPPKTPHSWSEAKEKWQWDVRATAWDLHHQELEDQAWTQRYEQARREAWEDYVQFRIRAMVLLRLPLPPESLNSVQLQQLNTSVLMRKAADLFLMRGIGDLNMAKFLLEKNGFAVDYPGLISDLDGPTSQDDRGLLGY